MMQHNITLRPDHQKKKLAVGNFVVFVTRTTHVNSVLKKAGAFAQHASKLGRTLLGETAGKCYMEFFCFVRYMQAGPQLWADIGA